MPAADADLRPAPPGADLPTVTADTTLRDVLDTMLGADSDAVLVTETGTGRPLGSLDLAHLKAAIRPTEPS